MSAEPEGASFVYTLRDRLAAKAGGQQAYDALQQARAVQFEADQIRRRQVEKDNLLRIKEAERQKQAERRLKKERGYLRGGLVPVARPPGQPANATWLRNEAMNVIVHGLGAGQRSRSRQELQDVVEGAIAHQMQANDILDTINFNLKPPMGAGAIRYGLDIVSEDQRRGRVIEHPFDEVLRLARRVMAGKVIQWVTEKTANDMKLPILHEELRAAIDRQKDPNTARYDEDVDYEDFDNEER